MGTYIRAYPDFSFEVVITSGKFKKRRAHVLINPNSQVELDVFANKDAAVNPEGVTHLVYLRKIKGDEECFLRTLRLAELLNKPVIVDEDSGTVLRSEGMSVKQLRYITDEDVIPGLKIIPIEFEWKDYEPDREHVNLNPQPDKSPIQKGLENVVSSVSNVLNFFNPAKLLSKEEVEDTPIMEVDRAMAMLLVFNKTRLLLPLDDFGCRYVDKISEMHSPTVIAFSESTVSEVIQLEMRAKNIMVFDKNHPKDKELFIPKSVNDTDFDIKLASTEEWVELL